MKIMQDIDNSLSPHSKKGKAQLKELRRRRALLDLIRKYVDHDACRLQIIEWNRPGEIT
jgi:hypothetical protein